MGSPERDTVPKPPPTHQATLDYASDDRRGDASSPRGVHRWMILLLCWLIGLCVWTIYLAGIIYLFFRFLA